MNANELLLVTCNNKNTSHRCIVEKKKADTRGEIQVDTDLNLRASLVAQWLGIRLPMQGTRVRAPVREDPTCHGAAKPVRYNY